MPFRRFLSFLTVGNKSECGTLQCLTHPRQSTAEPALMPTSFPKRQVSQRKSCVPSSVSAHSSHPPLLPTRLSFPPTSPSHPRTQRTYIPPAPPAAPHLRPRYTPRHSPRLSPRHPRRHSPDTPPGTPQTHPSLPKVARNSSRASFADGLKTPEYQRSYFNT